MTTATPAAASPGDASAAVAGATDASAAELALWSRWRDGRDVLAREALLGLHLPYARTVAATYYARRRHDEIEFADYLQCARLGLLEALDRYDPARGARFRTYAARRMHGAILDGIERCTEKQQQIAARERLRRERLQLVKASAGAPPQEEHLFGYLAEVGIGLALCRLLEGTGMVDLGEEPSMPAPDRAYDAPELALLQRRTLAAVERLHAQQRTVIRYHYLQQQPFDTIAARLAVTRSRISQIHRQALVALRAQLGTGSDSAPSG